MLRTWYQMLCTAIIGAMAVILLNACGTSAGATGTVPAPSASAPSALAGTHWVLTSFKQGGVEQPPLAGTQLTLQFDNGTVSGKAGCNSFGGTYVVTGQTLTISDLNQTLMACDPPIGQQEERYTTALLKAQSFVLQGQTLTITHPDGTLHFTRA